MPCLGRGQVEGGTNPSRYGSVNFYAVSGGLCECAFY